MEYVNISDIDLDKLNLDIVKDEDGWGDTRFTIIDKSTGKPHWAMAHTSFSSKFKALRIVAKLVKEGVIHE